MCNLETYVSQAEAMLDILNVPYSRNIEWTVNSRAKNRWGNTRRYPDGSYTISIASKLLESDEQRNGAINTVIHEMLHTVPDGMTHKGMWKHYADLVNDTYHVGVTRCSSADDKGVDEEPISSYRYILRCEKCGYEIGRNRMSEFVKNPGRWRHSSPCCGKFIRVK